MEPTSERVAETRLCNSENDAISICDPATRKDVMFDLARCAKTLGLDGMASRPLVEKWAETYDRNIDDSWIAFLSKVPEAKRPWRGDVAKIAMSHVDKHGVPSWIADHCKNYAIKEPRVHRVAALLYHLDALAEEQKKADSKSDDCYVELRRAGEWLGVSHEQARSYMKCLDAVGITAVSKKGFNGRCTRRKWLVKAPENQGLNVLALYKELYKEHKHANYVSSPEDELASAELLRAFGVTQDGRKRLTRTILCFLSDVHTEWLQKTGWRLQDLPRSVNRYVRGTLPEHIRACLDGQGERDDEWDAETLATLWPLGDLTD